MSDTKTRIELERKFREYVKRMDGLEMFQELSGSRIEALCMGFMIQQANETTKQQEQALPLNVVSFSETNNICHDCGKYKRLQGNGIIHQLCECGSEAEVCSHEFLPKEAWVHKCFKCGELHIEYKEQT